MASYAYNPITNKIDRIGDNGGGGGGDITIRGEDGSSITGDDFTFSGQKYGASETPISEVDTSTGEVVTNVNAWETPYVVDPSTTEGEKGTYATIQAAIDAAVMDGAALNSAKVIVLRAGVYQEDLNIPPGIFLRGQNLIASANPAIPEIVEIHGNHTLQDLNLFRAQGISFRNLTLDTPIFSFASGATTVFFNFINCWINNGNCAVKAITIGYQFNRFESCTFHGISHSTIMEVLPGSAIRLSSCVFTSSQKVLNSGSFNVVDSSLGEIILSGGSINASGCTFRSEASCFSGSSAGIVANSCFFACVGSAVNVTPIAASGVTLNACSIFEGDANLYEFGSTLYTKTSISGNVHPHVLVEGDTSMNSRQQVVYCNTENDPCNLTLPQNPSLDRVWTIKDSFGNASNNPITLSSISSQTVDKQASYVIDSNFGSVTLQATETGDFVVLSETKTSGGGSGTVTSASVVSANGFSGSVANPTTTPSITLSTTIGANQPVYSAGSSLAGAGAGTSGQVFTSNGGATPPSWQTLPAGISQVVVRTFASNVTYTPSAGMKYCIVEAVGGGGGGGGTVDTSAGQCSAGGGGASGSYARARLTAAQVGASQAVTIGVGGIGGTPTDALGGSGGTTTLGSLVSASGGTGGRRGIASAVSIGGGGTGNGASLIGTYTCIGNPGNPGMAFYVGTTSYGSGGNGGNTVFGAGALGPTGSFGENGVTAVGQGGGGSGAYSMPSQTGKAGGAGDLGLMIITEFI